MHGRNLDLLGVVRFSLEPVDVVWFLERIQRQSAEVRLQRRDTTLNGLKLRRLAGFTQRSMYASRNAATFLGVVRDARPSMLSSQQESAVNKSRPVNKSRRQQESAVKQQSARQKQPAAGRRRLECHIAQWHMAHIARGADRASIARVSLNSSFGSQHLHRIQA